MKNIKLILISTIALIICSLNVIAINYNKPNYSDQELISIGKNLGFNDREEINNFIDAIAELQHNLGILDASDEDPSSFSALKAFDLRLHNFISKNQNSNDNAIENFYKNLNAIMETTHEISLNEGHNLKNNNKVKFNEELALSKKYASEVFPRMKEKYIFILGSQKTEL